MRSKLLFSLLIALVFTATSAPAATYEIDAAHSSVGFKVKHLVVSNVRGAFNSFNVEEMEFDGEDPANWKVSATIDAASIDTGNQDRDDHLRGEDFLNVAEYPQITFVSVAIQPSEDGLYALHGDLTMHGVTKRIVLDLEHNGTIEDPWGGTRSGFTATGEIDRRDFGLTWNKAIEAGGVVVGDEVKITLEIEAIRK